MGVLYYPQPPATLTRRAQRRTRCSRPTSPRSSANWPGWSRSAPPVVAGEAVAAAMTLIAPTDALLIDLRRCLGGSPDMVAMLCSYLFGEEPVHLIDVLDRPAADGMAQVRQSWTMPFTPGRRFGPDKPVFVLTSGTTFSGAEELSYDLQQLGRATVVGERTRGAPTPPRGSGSARTCRRPSPSPVRSARPRAATGKAPSARRGRAGRRGPGRRLPAGPGPRALAGGRGCPGRDRRRGAAGPGHLVRPGGLITARAPASSPGGRGHHAGPPPSRAGVAATASVRSSSVHFCVGITLPV
jgi:Peptidase family S41